MKYYLIAGEASGDLHASHLMQAIKREDPNAEFRFYGGDMMAAVGGQLVQHYRDLAYMGFIPVLLHLRTILRGMKHCKQDIMTWQPDALILIDYPGFNLSIAKYIHQNSSIPVHYYIAPKIWAWKERRIKHIKHYVDHLYSILPFEVDFFEGKHGYRIDYVGNPTVDEIDAFTQKSANQSKKTPHHAQEEKPIIALLPGSRRQEIEGNLSRMMESAKPFANDYQLVIAGAPGIEKEFYSQFTTDTYAELRYGETFTLLSSATAALVTSGTATLETALFRVPQVVCYWMRCGWFINMVRPYFLKVPYISLVNLIADHEVVPELVANQMNAENCRKHLADILPGGEHRHAQLEGYELMAQRLGEPGAPLRAARLIVDRTQRKEL